MSTRLPAVAALALVLAGPSAMAKINAWPLVGDVHPGYSQLFRIADEHQQAPIGQWSLGDIDEDNNWLADAGAGQLGLILDQGPGFVLYQAPLEAQGSPIVTLRFTPSAAHEAPVNVPVFVRPRPTGSASLSSSKSMPVSPAASRSAHPEEPEPQGLGGPRKRKSAPPLTAGDPGRQKLETPEGTPSASMAGAVSSSAQLVPRPSQAAAYRSRKGAQDEEAKEPSEAPCVTTADFLHPRAPNPEGWDLVLDGQEASMLLEGGFSCTTEPMAIGALGNPRRLSEDPGASSPSASDSQAASFDAHIMAGHGVPASASPAATAPTANPPALQEPCLARPSRHTRYLSRLSGSDLLTYDNDPARTLGSGSFARVVKAETHEGGIAAAKLWDRRVYDRPSQPGPKMAALLNNEIETHRHLSHPNIIKVMGHRQTPHHYIMIMEMGLKSLAELVRDNRPAFPAVPLPALKKYAWQILNGLAYLHDRKLVHGDFKGKNILLSPSGEMKIADFGNVKSFNTQTQKALPGENYNGCTLLWASPEMLHPEGYDDKADLWAFGCVLLELISGRDPWSEKGFTTHPAIAYQLVKGFDVPQIVVPEPQASNLEQLPADLRLIVRQCLNRDPAQRPSARQLLQHEYFKELRAQGEASSSSSSLGPNGGTGAKLRNGC